MLTVAVALCQVLLFEQPGCSSCKTSYRELSKYPNLKVEIYDITRDRELVRTYGIIGAPTLIFIKNGQEIGRVFGYMPPMIKSLAEKCS